MYTTFHQLLCQKTLTHIFLFTNETFGPIFMSLTEKKQDLLIRGRKNTELDEYYGFVVENNAATVELMCNIGMQAHDSEYNALGYNRMGIYLCKHADVCLQHALVKYSGSACLRLVICKVRDT